MIVRTLLAASLLLGLAVDARAAPRAYGCFKVTAPALNIRDGAWATANVIGTAERGEILVKRKRFCTWRGYWCAIRKGSLEGWADVSLMERVECPASLIEDE